MKRYIYIIISVIIVGTLLSSCHSVKLRDAEEQYQRGEYYDAAATYKKVYNKLTKREDRPQRGYVAFQMGECYRKLNMTARATAAYQNAIRYKYPDSMAIYYLARELQNDGKYVPAEKSYNEFLKLVPTFELAKEGIRGCELAQKWKSEPTRYIIHKDKLFNGRRGDFCPMFLDGHHDQIYFTTNTEKALGTKKSEITGAKNCDVYFSKKDEKGNWIKPDAAEGELNTELDEGVTAFTPDGSTMYLAKARRAPNSPTSVEIYTSQRSEAKWSAPVKYDVTADTLSSYGDPAVSPDGAYLYFVSDMPGGQGGKDIWRIGLKDHTGTLENLGPQINTAGDERFPFCRTDSVLYFSSDGHAGMGGLDIFKATRTKSGGWNVENMGFPMNSNGDDFGITFGDAESGYFSSNRGDGRGFDHIYSFVLPDLQISISGNVLDKDDEPVPGAIIRIVGNDGSNQKAIGKDDGTFNFKLQRGVHYVMLAGAKDHLNCKQEFVSDMEEEDAEYNVDFVLPSIVKPQVIENIFYDFNKATLRPESKKALNDMVKVLNDNPNVIIEMGAHTDRIGSEAYNIKLSELRAKSVVDYLVKAGINPARLQPHGYGKTVPKTVTKRIAKQYPQFKEGDVLTDEFISKLSKENQAAADQINRRTEFKVTGMDFGMY
jgi:outer membrane protein OmpA-like peptidoglycan-associated protein